MSDQQRPPQSQEPPGTTADMTPRPRDEMADYEGRGLLRGRTALVTGGDSGIGRAVAVAFSKEGADVAIAYLDEHKDARHTVELVEAAGARGPDEIAPSYVFLASERLSGFYTGQVLSPIGGETHPG